MAAVRPRPRPVGRADRGAVPRHRQRRQGERVVRLGPDRLAHHLPAERECAGGRSSGGHGRRRVRGLPERSRGRHIGALRRRRRAGAERSDRGPRPGVAGVRARGTGSRGELQREVPGGGVQRPPGLSLPAGAHHQGHRRRQRRVLRRQAAEGLGTRGEHREGFGHPLDRRTGDADAGRRAGRGASGSG